MTKVRTILSITGSDRIGFLQNLVTNDVPNNAGQITYAALLTPQGKFVADFFLVPRADDILIDVATTHAATLYQKLSLYRLRADVQISETTLSVSNGQTDAPAEAVTDPRHPSLGWRLYHSGPEAYSDDTKLRVAHVVPETGIELTPDTYILEAGFERLNGVNFRKGCFVGQEIVARMKHKTELRKGLRKFKISTAVDVGTNIQSNGKTIGTVYSQADGYAIAHVRFDRLDGELSAGAATLTLSD